MSKILGGILGFGAVPKTTTTAATDLATDEVKSKKTRRNQFITEGGVSGQELSPAQVGGRNTTFGN